MRARIIPCLIAALACLGCEAAPTPAATPDAANDTAALDAAADVPAPADVAADAPAPADAPADALADTPPPADVPPDVPAPADVPADVPAPVDITPCDPTGGLPVPKTKRAKMVATFDLPAGGYNGVLEPFDGTSDESPTSSQFVYGNIVSWLASEVKGLTDTRSVSITFDMVKPAACKVYSVTSAKAGNNHMSWNHQGKAWNCDGSVMIDTVNGKAYQFHFDGNCIGAPDSTPPSLGSVHMVGKGAALL